MLSFKKIKFYAKCSDLCGGEFIDENGKEYYFDGYPPSFLGDNGIDLEIDLKTGQILNWKEVEDSEILEYLEFNEEDKREDHEDDIIEDTEGGVLPEHRMTPEQKRQSKMSFSDWLEEIENKKEKE